MAFISTLVSDFTDMPAFFNGNFNGAAIVDGRGEVPTIGAYAAFATAEGYTLTGDSVFVQVVQASGTSGSLQNSVKCEVDDTNSIEMSMDGGTFKGRVQKAGATSDTALGTYNATTHAYWRVREAGGTVFWDTSTDASTWTNRGAAVHGLDLSAVSLKLQAGHWNAADPDGVNAIYDNLNVGPAPPAPQVAQSSLYGAAFFAAG